MPDIDPSPEDLEFARQEYERLGPEYQDPLDQVKDAEAWVRRDVAFEIPGDIQATILQALSNMRMDITAHRVFEALPIEQQQTIEQVAEEERAGEAWDQQQRERAYHAPPSGQELEDALEAADPDYWKNLSDMHEDPSEALERETAEAEERRQAWQPGLLPFSDEERMDIELAGVGTGKDDPRVKELLDMGVAHADVVNHIAQEQLAGTTLAPEQVLPADQVWPAQPPEVQEALDRFSNMHSHTDIAVLHDGAILVKTWEISDPIRTEEYGLPAFEIVGSADSLEEMQRKVLEDDARFYRPSPQQEQQDDDLRNRERQVAEALQRQGAHIEQIGGGWARVRDDADPAKPSLENIIDWKPDLTSLQKQTLDDEKFWRESQQLRLEGLTEAELRVPGVRAALTREDANIPNPRDRQTPDQPMAEASGADLQTAELHALPRWWQPIRIVNNTIDDFAQAFRAGWKAFKDDLDWSAAARAEAEDHYAQEAQRENQHLDFLTPEERAGVIQSREHVQESQAQLQHTQDVTLILRAFNGDPVDQADLNAAVERERSRDSLIANQRDVSPYNQEPLATVSGGPQQPQDWWPHASQDQTDEQPDQKVTLTQAVVGQVRRVLRL